MIKVSLNDWYEIKILFFTTIDRNIIKKECNIVLKIQVFGYQHILIDSIWLKKVDY